MKMVKSLLLGTTAGLIAVAGAQAADMPVKAAPVQYVKICTLYGDGFYYVPGTDICLKIGGYVRAEYAYGQGSGAQSMTNVAFNQASGSMKDRTDGQDFTMRTRAYAWFDSRQQTEYGTLRTYFQVGVNFDNPNGFSSTGTANGFSANRAFIQFAGFTIGLAQSFYDFYSSPASSYWGPPSSDTGDGGYKVFAYTAQFGNGLSSTFSFEEPRSMNNGGQLPNSGVMNTNLGNPILGTITTDTDRAKVRFPDIVNNWRVDQAWGSAQVMVAAHDVSGGYYAANTGVNAPLTGPVPCTSPVAGFLGVGAGSLTGSEVCGHPADKIGWAVGGGSRHNVGTSGDYFQWQANYTQGAVRYVAFTAFGYSPVQFSGQNLGYGFMSDGVFSNATGEVQLTTAWGINAAYDHLWTPQLRTSIYGSYAHIEYGNNANLAICNAQTTPNLAGTGLATPSLIPGSIAFTQLQVQQGACNNNFNWWTAGSRTQYNFTPWFYVGFDVMYSKLESASAGNTVTYTSLAGAAKPTSFYQVQSQDNYALRIRIHRDIVP